MDFYGKIEQKDSSLAASPVNNCPPVIYNSIAKGASTHNQTSAKTNSLFASIHTFGRK